MSKHCVGSHFAILLEADLIQGNKQGTTILYHLNLSVLEEALLGFMNAFEISRGDDHGDSTNISQSDATR